MVDGQLQREAPHRARAGHQGKGVLVLVGGHEDKQGDCTILKDVVARIGRRPIVVATIASQQPAALWRDYSRVLRRLGARDLIHLRVGSRREALAISEGDAPVRDLRGAGGVFFTGGSQLRITTTLGGTLLCAEIEQVFERGGVVAGTSAGASALPMTMLVSGDGGRSHRLGDALRMAPGLGLIEDLVVDQHFAERGRIGRLVAAVAQNPKVLGVGIDEDTAIALETRRRFRVLGAGAVYVVDGTSVSATNLVEGQDNRTFSAYDVRLHLLNAGDVFDLERRQPCDPEETPEADLCRQHPGRRRARVTRAR